MKPKKKRLTISAGSLNDHEAGTLFFQRGYKKGKKPKHKRHPHTRK
jgi:hypothetical protein